MFVAAEPHQEDAATVLRAVKLREELRLATAAPHDLVMIDGTLTLPVIYFNQALNKAPDTPALRCAEQLLHHSPAYLAAFLTLLQLRALRQALPCPAQVLHAARHRQSALLAARPRRPRHTQASAEPR